MRIEDLEFDLFDKSVNLDLDVLTLAFRKYSFCEFFWLALEVTVLPLALEFVASPVVRLVLPLATEAAVLLLLLAGLVEFILAMFEFLDTDDPRLPRAPLVTVL